MPTIAYCLPWQQLGWGRRAPECPHICTGVKQVISSQQGSAMPQVHTMLYSTANRNAIFTVTMFGKQNPSILKVQQREILQLFFSSFQGWLRISDEVLFLKLIIYSIRSFTFLALETNALATLSQLVVNKNTLQVVSESDHTKFYFAQLWNINFHTLATALLVKFRKIFKKLYFASFSITLNRNFYDSRFFAKNAPRLSKVSETTQVQKQLYQPSSCKGSSKVALSVFRLIVPRVSCKIFLLI